MGDAKKLRTEAVAGAFMLLVLITPFPVWLKWFLGVIGSLCLLTAIFPRPALLLQRRWTGDDAGDAARRATKGALKHPERNYIPMDPEALRGQIHASGTSVQQVAEAAPFIGKWLRVEGTIADVCPLYDNAGMLVYLQEHKRIVYTLTLVFSSEWTQRLEHLTAGTPVVVHGVVQELEHRGLKLSRCELGD